MDDSGKRHSLLDLLQHVMPVTGFRFSWETGLQKSPCPAMTLPEPAWRVRTRPCPFYQQGRCIFAGSCNFLHTAPPQSAPGARTSLGSVENYPQSSARSTPVNPPLISVESPHSIRSPRSPRFASLLLALKDVLGDDPEDELVVEPTIQDSSTAMANTSWSANSTTFVDDTNPATEKVLEKCSPPSSPPNTIPPFDTNDPLFNDQHSFVHDSQIGDNVVRDAGSPPLPYADPDVEDDALQIDASASFNQPSIHTISSSPVAEDDLEGQYVEHTHSAVRDDLLSPVEVSNLQLANFARASMDMTEYVDDDDTWRPPFPLAFSPPRSPAPGSTFELLASPFGSPSSRVLSPRLSAFIGRHPIVATGGNANDQGARDSDLDSPRARPVQENAEPTKTSSPDALVTAEEDGVLSPVYQVLADGGEEPDIITEDERSKMAEDEQEDSEGSSIGDEEENSGEFSIKSEEEDSEKDSIENGEEDSGKDSSEYEGEDSGKDSSEYEGEDSGEDLIERERDESQEDLGDTEGDEGDVCFSSVSRWYLEGGETAVHFGRQQSARQEVQFAIKRSSQTPTRFLQSPEVEFYQDETIANSSTTIKGQEQEVIRGISDPIPSGHDSISPARQPLSIAEPLPELPPPDFQESAYDQSPEVRPPALVQESHEVPKKDLIDEVPVFKEEVSEDVGNESNLSTTARLAHLEPGDEEQSGDGNSFTSLYNAYSDFSASPPVSQESALSAEVQECRSTDTTPGESSSISTPLSFTRERVFTPPSPEDRSRMMMSEVLHHSQSPISSRRSISLSRRSSRLGSPFVIQPENRDVIGNVDDIKSPVSEGSRKVPFGWRNSLVSNRSSKSARTSRTSRTITRPILESLTSPLPADEPPSLCSSPSSPAPHTSSRLRPLRLSIILNSQSQPSRPAPSDIPSASSNHQQQPPGNRRVSMSISNVSSNRRMSHNPSLSSRFSLMSDRMRNNLISSDSRIPSPLTSDNFAQLSNFGPPLSAPASHSHIWRRASIYSMMSQDEYPRTSSRLSEPAIRPIDEEDDDDYCEHYETHDQNPERKDDNDEHIYRRITPPPIPTPPHSATVVQPARPFYHAVSTAKPTLMFAIASDDVAEVKRVLESGDVGPNDAIGPQTALEFALTNDQLTNKMEIVKTLLAYGADPRAVKQSNAAAQRRASITPEGAGAQDVQEPPATSLIDDIDPALKYYVERADAPHTRRTSALIHRSFFRPLTRVRYELIGQDCVLEQLFRVLSMQSRGLSVAPIVVLLCGPSGHGKSLLARKFGSLLDVPTHTVNMTTLKSTHDIWQSHSMSPYETPTTCTLAEFLINNEGKRCVVVLDEIEKTDEKTLWSLLMPWELGRCSFEAGSRHIDVRSVVWLGTSNIGHDLVFKHHEARARPDDMMAREEYVELMGLLRPLVSERLGASVLSRVTTVLPFVPFTLEEKKAICSEALYSLGGDDVRSLSVKMVESVIRDALASYCPAEGARSLYRAISSRLMDII